MAVIEIRDLTKRFGDVVAVDRLSFDVEAGTVVGFLGPNGAGKTTTLRMLLGVVAPTAGTALINGQRYVDLAAPTRTVGAVLESSSFHPGRTARNHLRVAALAGGIPRARVDAVLDFVELTSSADRRVGGFSLGMRQRLGLATALLGNPQVLILDEPANGLDPEGVRWLRTLLRSLANDGTTVLVSSHILAEVSQTVDSVVILDHGRLVTHAGIAELTNHQQQTVRVVTPRAVELRAALLAESASVRKVANDTLEVSGATGKQIGLLAASLGIPLFESTTVSSNLEDVFFQLTQAQEAEVAR